MKNNKRPPLYWKTWRIAGPALVVACVALVFDGHAVRALLLVFLALLIFLVPWLLTPYSKTARRITRADR